MNPLGKLLPYLVNVNSNARQIVHLFLPSINITCNYENNSYNQGQAIIESWSESWVRTNVVFEGILQNGEDLNVFSSKIFMIRYGNYRLQAWLPIINRDHTHDFTWHYAFESIILDAKGDVAIMLAALHEVNW